MISSQPSQITSPSSGAIVEMFAKEIDQSGLGTSLGHNFLNLAHMEL